MSNQANIPAVEAGTPARQLGWSVWAIVAGFLAVVILSIGTDIVLHKLHVYPPMDQRLSDNLSLLATFYRTIYSILGSYITARVAPNRPMLHALVGAGIGMVLGTVGVVTTWHKELGPHWYPIALVVAGIPCAWIGARVWEAQISPKN